jgi:hypothetical protein
MSKAQTLIASVISTQVHEDDSGFLLILDDGSALNILVDEEGHITAQAVTVRMQGVAS